ncbi:hypothetical protein ZIOFF_025849 [Zingiber officinale]|uniref:Uncharacterized protein n=1 Tax=Zingiber officinale TaxID=94328 RepID=A0A8J5GUS2_ZINOF|nr:hypothetical protein ZIOFF_025849 [Zingiber officinale]
MCATSYRYSNCLEQLKKAHTKTTLVVEDQIHDPTRRKSEVTELACQLSRGQVKGWTVVEPARKYLNKKSRRGTQDECSFSRNYKKLRKHVHLSHPHAKPPVVDPVTDRQGIVRISLAHSSTKRLEGESRKGMLFVNQTSNGKEKEEAVKTLKQLIKLLMTMQMKNKQDYIVA